MPLTNRSVLTLLDDAARHLSTLRAMQPPPEALTTIYLIADDLSQLARKLTPREVAGDPYEEAGESEYDELRRRHLPGAT